MLTLIISIMAVLATTPVYADECPAAPPDNKLKSVYVYKEYKTKSGYVELVECKYKHGEKYQIVDSGVIQTFSNWFYHGKAQEGYLLDTCTLSDSSLCTFFITPPGAGRGWTDSLNL